MMSGRHCDSKKWVSVSTAAEKVSKLRTENQPLDLPRGGVANLHKDNFSGTIGDKSPSPSGLEREWGL